MKPMDVDESLEGVTEPSLALNVCTTKLCMVCEESPMQYKCPRCDYLTCSLKCCKQHKIEVRFSLNGLLLLTESSL
jgi:HIT zinc finger